MIEVTDKMVEAAHRAYHTQMPPTQAHVVPKGQRMRAAIEAALAAREPITHGIFKIGDRVRKVSGSSWRGHIVGFYNTNLTPIGYCVESELESGSIQIYPEKALEFME